MKKLRLLKNIAIILVLVSVTAIAIYLYSSFKNNDPSEDEVVDTIDNFSYVLDKSNNDYYKSCFEELKNVLREEEINYEEYAKVITKLFVSDLFTLSNKVSRGDVGGISFVYSSYQKDFIEIAKESLYNSVKSNLYGDRKQELPTVTEVSIKEIKKITFKANDQFFEEAYGVVATMTYEKDMGYPTECNLTLVRIDNLLEVAKLK